MLASSNAMQCTSEKNNYKQNRPGAYTETHNFDMMQNYFILKNMAGPPHFYKEPPHQVNHVMTSTCINFLPLNHPCRVSCSTCLVLVITSLNSSVRALPPDPAAATAAAWRGGFGGTATVPGAMPAERWRTWWNTTRRYVTHTSG